MTATTPPINAWYVLEDEGTGLASAGTQGEKTQRRGRCGRRCAAEVPARPTGALGHPSLPCWAPSAPSCRDESRRRGRGRQRGRRGGESGGRRLKGERAERVRDA